MKKIISFCVIVTFALSVCSCNAIFDQENKEEYLQEIYAMDDAFIGTEAEKGAMNLISSKDKTVGDPDVVSKKTISIGNNEYEISYADTFKDAVSGKIYRKYWIDEAKGYFVNLEEDGAVKFISFPFASIEISSSDTPQAVLSKLRPKLQETVDISGYEHVDIPEKGISSERFGVYTFTFYNVADERYVTDFCRVTVQDNGEVRAFAKNDVGIDIPEISIDRQLEAVLIELKLRQLYTVSGSTYNSCKEVSAYQIVAFNGELYVQYSVSAVYTDSSGENITSYLNRILIPLELINIK